MAIKNTNASWASIFLIANVLFFLYGLNYIGVFSKYQYLTEIKGTTGPNYWVISGDLKLKTQMPDTAYPQDCSGIMVDNESNSAFF